MATLTTSNIFRYKFDSPIVNLINTFAATHKYDDSSQFREEWDEFIKDNKASIDREKQRLINKGGLYR